MPKKWTGKVICEMHNSKITIQNLADEMGVTKQYISMILNSHREPDGVEQRVKEAIARIKGRNTDEEKS